LGEEYRSFNSVTKKEKCFYVEKYLGGGEFFPFAPSLKLGQYW
jgi:hypothetical protein